MRTRQFIQRLRQLVPVLLILFCAVQPLLDALSYWQDHLKLATSLSLVPRMLLMLLMALIGYLVSDRRHIYWIAAGVLAAFWGCHMAVCFRAGYQSPIQDTENYLRILMLPVAAISMISCLRANKAAFAALKNGLVLAFCLTVAFALIAVLTGTEPYTYPDKALGIRGWCFWPNAQSAILSLLAPVVISWVVEKKPQNLLLCSLAVVAALGALYLHGTRLAFAGLLATGVGLAAAVLLTKAAPKRLAAVLLAVTAIFTACLPVSPMVQNQNRVTENFAVRAQLWNRLESAGETAAQAEGLTGQDYEIRRLETGYTFFLPDLVERFGLQTVMESYNYTEDAAALANERSYKLHYCRLLMEQSGGLSKAFGVDCAEMVIGQQSYDVENDFHGIYFMFGLVGLGLLLLFFGYFLLRIVLALVRDFRRTFTLEAVAFGISLCTCLAHAYFTCAVLRRPNTLFYLAALLAAIYELTRRRDPAPQEK